MRAQWGSALAFATAQYGMECEVWQVAASYKAKPGPQDDDGDLGRHAAFPAPSELTEFGRQLLS